jgi:hypothetical protein
VVVAALAEATGTAIASAPAAAATAEMRSRFIMLIPFRAFSKLLVQYSSAAA